MKIKKIIRNMLLIGLIAQPFMAQASWIWQTGVNIMTSMALNAASAYLPATAVAAISAYQWTNSLYYNPITSYCLGNIDNTGTITQQATKLAIGACVFAGIKGYHDLNEEINQPTSKSNLNSKQLIDSTKNLSIDEKVELHAKQVYKRACKYIPQNSEKPTIKEFVQYQKEKRLKKLDFKNKSDF